MSATLLNRPFDVFVPAAPDREAVKVATITVQVRVDVEGDEILTPESLRLIETTQARYMGLLSGDDIRAMRHRLNLSQDELSGLLGCGKKSLSRWENGHGYPSQLVNTILRALDEGFLTPAQLRGLQQPRTNWGQLLYKGLEELRCWHIPSCGSIYQSAAMVKFAGKLTEEWMPSIKRAASSQCVRTSPARHEMAVNPALIRGQMKHLCLEGS